MERGEGANRSIFPDSRAIHLFGKVASALRLHPAVCWRIVWDQEVSNSLTPPFDPNRSEYKGGGEPSPDFGSK